MMNGTRSRVGMPRSVETDAGGGFSRRALHAEGVREKDDQDEARSSSSPGWGGEERREFRLSESADRPRPAGYEAAARAGDAGAAADAATAGGRFAGFPPTGGPFFFLEASSPNLRPLGW